MAVLVPIARNLEYEINCWYVIILCISDSHSKTDNLKSCDAFFDFSHTVEPILHECSSWSRSSRHYIGIIGHSRDNVFDRFTGSSHPLGQSYAYVCFLSSCIRTSRAFLYT